MSKIQIGIIAYREPTGEFKASRPIYNEVDEEEIFGTEQLDELAYLFAGEFSKYMQMKKEKKDNEASYLS